MHQEMNWRRLLGLAAAMLILGVLIGVGAGLLTLLLYGVEQLMLGYVENAAFPGPFDVPTIRRVLSVTIGLTIAGVVWYFLRTKTTKVPSVKQAVEGNRMPVWQTIAHVVLQIFIVGSGASIGREVAPRELGAMLAGRLCEMFHIERRAGFTQADRRMIVAVAAGAGLGGVYNAPLAGMFFAIEMLLVDITLEKAAFALGMSAVAACVATGVKGRHTFYDIASIQQNPTISLMLFAVIIGICCGIAGACFRKGSQWAGAHKATGTTLLWMMPLAGVLTGLIAVAVPQVMGNGRAAAQLGFSTGRYGASSPWSLLGFDVDVDMLTVLAILALTFIAKAAATLLTMRAGASGGVLQPGIALGATLGAMVGIVWTIAFPNDSLAACALIGAAALLAASQQAPLMAMCLVMELTGAPISFFVPVGMGVAISSLTSRWTLVNCGSECYAVSAKRTPGAFPSLQTGKVAP